MADASYFLDHYGTCKLGAFCGCAKQKWIGRACPQWRPLGITSFEGLIEHAKAKQAEARKQKEKLDDAAKRL